MNGILQDLGGMEAFQIMIMEHWFSSVSLLWTYLKQPSSLSVSIEHLLCMGHMQENVMSV